MANMSYCRFRNTLSDFKDCLDTLRKEGIHSLSIEERRAALDLTDLAKNMVEEFENEDYDFTYDDEDEDEENEY